MKSCTDLSKVLAAVDFHRLKEMLLTLCSKMQTGLRIKISLVRILRSTKILHFGKCWAGSILTLSLMQAKCKEEDVRLLMFKSAMQLYSKLLELIVKK